MLERIDEQSISTFATVAWEKPRQGAFTTAFLSKKYPQKNTVSSILLTDLFAMIACLFYSSLAFFYSCLFYSSVSNFRQKKQKVEKMAKSIVFVQFLQFCQHFFVKIFNFRCSCMTDMNKKKKTMWPRTTFFYAKFNYKK